MNFANTEQIDEVLALVKSRREEIKNSPSVYPVGKNTYFVDSLCGSDKNSGKSPETAWRSLEKVAYADIHEGDVVLFRRGCRFRGELRALEGVTYSAYGEGPKPEMLGSIDASNPDDWVQTNVPNVWLFRPMIAYVKEVGSIIFDEGRCWGIKICRNWQTGERCDMFRNTRDPKNAEMTVFNGRSYVERECKPFNSLSDIKGDLEFFHHYWGMDGMMPDHLYLNCPDGNPAEVFGRVEISLRYSIFTVVGDNVTIDNIAFKYAGVHGISAGGYRKNLTVRNCEFSFIGGSGIAPERYLMKYNPPYSHDTTRLGNGVEIYGTCDGFTVENCWFDQIYDTAITAQVHIDKDAAQPLHMKNVRWCNNVFYKCYNSWELWLSINDNDGSLGEMKNIDAAGNITLNGGFGWSHQRPDPTYADWLMWGKTPAMCHFENCGVHDNVILNSKRYIMHSASVGKTKVRFYNNTVIHGGKLGLLPETLEPATLPLKSFEISDENLALLEEKGVWENNKFYKLKSEQSGVDGFNPPIDL